MRIFLGLLIGAALGFIFGYIGQCTSGMCPFTSNPLITALLGAMFGVLFALK